MPELAEVEIVRRDLERLRSWTIVRAVSRDARVFDRRAPVTDRTIKSVGRRGKWLRLALDEGVIFSHLGMTGDWIIAAHDSPELRFERVRLDLERNGRKTSARYTDPRRFGRFIVSKSDIAEWKSLGPDPLLDEVKPRSLAAAMKKRKRAIKEVLMDQSVLAGVGNILATEALWNARIDPRTPSRALRERDAAAILEGLHRIIEKNLAYDIAMLNGPARSPFRIYGHKGEPCPRCKTKLRHIVLGGRGTTFCSKCQKRSRARSP